MVSGDIFGVFGVVSGDIFGVFGGRVHWCRNALSGSVRAAREAGMTVATITPIEVL